jgi:hypothetical protein
VQKASGPELDYGTDCRNCELYQKLGDVCVIEHGKRFLWEYCKDFVSQVVLPDYKELMKTVKKDQALEREKKREKKERERKKKLKERLAKKEEKRKKRRARLRRLREKEKKKVMLLQERASKKLASVKKQVSKHQVASSDKRSVKAVKVAKISGKAPKMDFEVVHKDNRVAPAKSVKSDRKARVQKHSTLETPSESVNSYNSNTPKTASSARATA